MSIMTQEASEVTLHEIPKWFQDIVFSNPVAETLDEWAIQRAATSSYKHMFPNPVNDHSFGSYWIDHWGTTIVDGEECFVSEPYGVTGLDCFCIVYGLKCEVTPCAYHNCGRCIRILFRPSFQMEKLT
jgi:hypothetical protein